VSARLKALGLVHKQRAHDLVFYILQQFNFCRIFGVNPYSLFMLSVEPKSCLFVTILTFSI
jgi:hypothetical protein